jgi:hypothetical protein
MLRIGLPCRAERRWCRRVRARARWRYRGETWGLSVVVGECTSEVELHWLLAGRTWTLRWERGQRWGGSWRGEWVVRSVSHCTMKYENWSRRRRSRHTRNQSVEAGAVAKTVVVPEAVVVAAAIEEAPAVAWILLLAGVAAVAAIGEVPVVAGNRPFEEVSQNVRCSTERKNPHQNSFLLGLLLIWVEGCILRLYLRELRL